MAARDAKCGAAHQHARSRHIASIDRVAQSYIAIGTGPYVSHRSEPRLQCNPRVVGADERLARHRDSQHLVAETRIKCQVSVSVDQTREHGSSRQVYDRSVGGGWHCGSRTHAHDLVTFDDNCRISERLPGLHVQNFLRTNDGASWWRERSGLTESRA